jgi:GR25 family glycosyltransferase involved in LPS biosynthesis
MKEIKYFVRTTDDRIYEYDLEHEKLIDTEHAPVKSFINQLKYISQWDSVLLEDDLILCKDFKKRIEEVINQYPDKIINFFTRPKE